ncbi:Lrp/AsnC family transcriptional regulator [Thermoproteota archaeon]
MGDSSQLIEDSSGKNEKSLGHSGKCQHNFLDVKDRRILEELDLDARQSNSSIAKKTKLSKEVVNYRVKNLIKKKIVNGFYSVIDVAKLGYTLYRLFFKFVDVDPEKEKEIMQFLKEQKKVTWVITLEGVHDLAVLICAKDVFKFKEVLDDLMGEYGKYLDLREITLVLKIHHFKHKYIYGAKDFTTAMIGGSIDDRQLDEVDTSILQILSKEARLPILNIAKQLKLSPNTVKYRIKNLLKSGVLVSFRPDINISKLGYQHYKVFLFMNKIDKQSKSRLTEFLKTKLPVIYVTEAIGGSDLEFEAHVKSSLELNQIIKEMRYTFPGLVSDYETTIVNKSMILAYIPVC